MNRIEIKGIIPPIITPMHADESINTAELRRQVDRQIENGVHALFCFGTNGEGYILDGREKQLVLETVIEQANGREDIIAENTLRMKVYQEFAPKMMSEDEVEAEVTAVLAELGLDAPTAKQKGLIMKTLMPRVKGKADGALVQNVLARHLA